MRFNLFEIGLLTLALYFASPAVDIHADDAQEARAHFDAGIVLLEAEDFNAAAMEFQASVGLKPTKNGYFNLANCYKALHQYGAALETIDTLEREYEGKLDRDWQREVAAFEQVVQGVVARVRIDVNEKGAAVSVDGKIFGTTPLESPIILGPGSYEIVVSKEGFHAERRTVALLSKQEKSEAFTLTPAGPQSVLLIEESPDERVLSLDEGETRPSTTTIEPIAKKRKPSWLFWTGLGATVVTGALSGVFFGQYSAAKGDVDNATAAWSTAEDLYTQTPTDQNLKADADQLYQDLGDETNRANRFKNLGVGFAITAGVLAIGTAIVLIVDKPHSEQETVAASFSVAPGGLLLSF